MLKAIRFDNIVKMYLSKPDIYFAFLALNLLRQEKRHINKNNYPASETWPSMLSNLEGPQSFSCTTTLIICYNALEYTVQSTV